MNGTAIFVAPIALLVTKNSCPMCWYGNQYDYGYHDVYPGGGAYHDRKLIKNQQGVTADFGFAIFDSASNTK